MESQIACEMDVFTPTLCSLERDSSMMNNVMGNKSVFGHCFFNTKLLQLSFFREALNILCKVAKEQCARVQLSFCNF